MLRATCTPGLGLRAPQLADGQGSSVCGYLNVPAMCENPPLLHRQRTSDRLPLNRAFMWRN